MSSPLASSNTEPLWMKFGKLSSKKWLLDNSGELGPRSHWGLSPQTLTVPVWAAVVARSGDPQGKWPCWAMPATATELRIQSQLVSRQPLILFARITLSLFTLEFRYVVVN